MHAPRRLSLERESRSGDRGGRLGAGREAASSGLHADAAGGLSEAARDAVAMGVAPVSGDMPASIRSAVIRPGSPKRSCHAVGRRRTPSPVPHGHGFTITRRVARPVGRAAGRRNRSGSRPSGGRWVTAVRESGSRSRARRSRLRGVGEEAGDGVELMRSRPPTGQYPGHRPCGQPVYASAR
ncbi:hypothetical protein FRZ03_22295 [Streptomyces misionensis]|uniref:Uncharacterized protein n=1 Tax=Streptomyces misionensis TaxID=67331 RepID=A0A5C6JFW5_9ACTN|nr:hypothetical protein FRZ03_22295 [Streptomyces misionensis]